MRQGFVLVTSLLIAFTLIFVGAAIISYATTTNKKVRLHLKNTQEYHHQKSELARQKWLESKI